MLCLAKGGDMMVAGFALDTSSRLQSIVDCWVDQFATNEPILRACGGHRCNGY